MIYRNKLVLAEGHISWYFGGKAMCEHTSPVTLLRWPFILAGLTAVTQVSLLFYKLLKSKKLTTQQRLLVTVADNLINVNGLKTFGLACAAIILGALLNMFLWEVDYNTKIFPKSLLYHSTFLLFFQIRPFFLNPALR